MQLRSCPLRYVLDAGASKQCADLLRDCPELTALEREVLRVPASEFWLEWSSETDDGSIEGDRSLGCLVQAAEDGRSGTVLPYYTHPDGRATRLPGVIYFDLDGEVGRNVRGTRNFVHRLFPHLDHILARAEMTMDPGWVKAAAKHGEATLANRMTQEAEDAWFFLPFLLTFSVLLYSPNVLRESPSTRRHQSSSNGNTISKSRCEPNQQRQSLDHIEVSLRLGEYASFSVDHANNANGGREKPRLHIVRGHYVSRGSKVFWRTSHLRGSGEWAGYSKTVRVKQARA